MQRKTRHLFIPSSTPDFTRPIVIASPRHSFVLVEPAKTDVLRGSIVPPWLQPIELKLEHNGGMQVSDLWSHQMRKKVVNEFFPGRVKSKVAAVFHQYYTDQEKRKSMSYAWKGKKSSQSTPSLVPEPEPEGVRFPPLRSPKRPLNKVAVERPVLNA